MAARYFTNKTWKLLVCVVGTSFSGCCDRPEIDAIISEPTKITVNQPTVFTALINVGNTCECKYTWEFTNPTTTVSGKQASYTFTKSGSYVVKLSIKNDKKNNHLENSLTKIFEVSEQTSSVVFWTQDSSIGEILVKLGSFGSRKITQYSNIAPQCVANSGTALFQDIPAAVYNYTATGKNLATWIGTVDLTKTVCNTVVLN